MEGKEAELRQKERELATTRRQVDQLNLDLQPLLQARSQVRGVQQVNAPPPSRRALLHVVRSELYLSSTAVAASHHFLALRCAPHSPSFCCVLLPAVWSGWTGQQSSE